MALQYSDWLTAAASTLQLSTPDGTAAFGAMVPWVIASAELKIYADPELDFPATRDVDDTQVVTPGIRSVPIPSQFVILEGVSLITPAGATSAAQAGAQRIPLQRATRQFCDMIWPIEANTRAPTGVNDTYWALFDMQQKAPAPGSADEPQSLPSSIIVSPTPDQAYRVEFTGVTRPAPLSSTNTSTYLLTYYPALFFAATMVYAAGWQRDYGAASDDPRMAVDWEQEYQKCKHAALSDSARQKSQGPGWTPFGLSEASRIPASPPGRPPQQ